MPMVDSNHPDQLLLCAQQLGQRKTMAAIRKLLVDPKYG